MAEPPNVYENVNLDILIQRANKSNDQKLIDTIHRKILSAKEWFYLSDKQQINIRSDGKSVLPPYMISNYDGRRTLFVFTNPENITKFLKAHERIDKENHSAISISPRVIIDQSEDMARNGIERILVNDNWEIPMIHLRSTYFHYIKPYNFEVLVNNAKGSNDANILLDLWRAVFDLPNWYFIGQPEKGQLMSTGHPSSLEVHLFLSYDYAIFELNNIKRNSPDLNFRVFGLPPEEALGFLNHVRKQVNIVGLLLREHNVNTGIQFQKIFNIRQLISQNSVPSR